MMAAWTPPDTPIQKSQWVPPEAGPKAEQPSTFESLWEGLKKGVGNVGLGAAQMGIGIQGAISGDPSESQRINKYMAEREQRELGPAFPGPGKPLSPARANPTAFGAGELGGEALATAPLAALPAGPAVSNMGRIGFGALGGGLGGAVAPVTNARTHGDYWAQKASQIPVGAAAGAGGAALGNLAGPILSPEQRMLKAGGQRFTPGMAMPGGEIQTAERALQAFPFVRSVVQGMVGRKVDDYNRVVARQVLEPLNGIVPNSVAAGHDLNRFVSKQLDDAFERVKPQLSLSRDGVASVIQNNPELTQLVAELPEDLQRRFNKMIEGRLLGRFKEGEAAMDGNTFKEVESYLSNRASRFVGTNDSELGDALYHTLGALREQLVKENPVVGPELQRINQSWAMWVRMRDAANRRATAEGKFIPSDLLQVVKRESTPGQFSRGDGLLQVLGEAGQKTIGGSLVNRRPEDAIRWGNIIHGVVSGVPYGAMAIAQKVPGLGRGVASAGTMAGAPAADTPRLVKRNRATEEEVDAPSGTR